MRGGALRLVAAGVVILLGVSACTEAPGGGEGSKNALGRVVGVGKVVDNRNDTQLQVDQLVFRPDGIELDGGFTNGSSDMNEIDLGAGTFLRDEDGHEYQARSGGRTLRVAPHSDRRLALTFRPALRPGASRLSVHLNDGANNDGENTTEPSMVLKNVPTRGRAARPALPAPAAAKSNDVHPNGTALRVDGITFAPTRIGVRVTLNNGGEHTSEIAAEDTYLSDDLGNTYPMQAPEDHDEGAVQVPEGKALDGVLVFAGRVHPDAKQLRLNVNAKFGQPDFVASSVPQFRAGPYRIGDQATRNDDTDRAALPSPLDVDGAKNHPNGTELRVSRFTFGEGTVSAKVTFDNGSDDAQVLNQYGGRDDTVLFDDQGNKYPLLPPKDNPELKVAPGKRLDATLVFSGRLSNDATSVRLAVNRTFGHADFEYTTTPKFDLGPYRVHRPAGEPTDDQSNRPGFAVGLRSDLENRRIGESQAREVARTTSTYDGEETDDGVRLTVPAAVLFDFDSAKLRQDGKVVVGELAEVLRYYEGAPATVAGYTDSIGSRAYNEKLSTKRANRVIDALVEDNGIERSRLTADGRGERDPVARNTNADGSDNPDGRQKNRRVVLEIETKKGLPR